MKVGKVEKQPAERVSISVMYDDALDGGDEVSMVEACDAVPDGFEASPMLVSGSRVRIWLSGGVRGVTYTITLRVVTAGGEIFEDEIMCKVK